MVLGLSVYEKGVALARKFTPEHMSVLHKIHFSELNIRKESSTVNPTLSDMRMLPTGIRVSTFWLSVSIIYLAASLLFFPVSLPIATVLRFPVGLFLLCAIWNQVDSRNLLK